MPEYTFGPFLTINNWFEQSKLPPGSCQNIVNAVLQDGTVSTTSARSLTTTISGSYDAPISFRQVTVAGATSWWSRSVDHYAREHLLDGDALYFGKITDTANSVNDTLSVRASDGVTETRLGIVIPNSNIAPTAFASATYAAPSTTPTLADGGSGGTFSGTYYVKTTAVYAGVESLPSVISSGITVTSRKITVTGGALPGTSTRVNVYIGTTAATVVYAGYYTSGSTLLLTTVPTDITRPPTGAVGTGAVAAGSYNYRFTYVDRFGHESPMSDATSNVTVPSSKNSISLPLPVGEGHVSYRRIYRINVGVTGYYQLVDQVDVYASTYIDKIANAYLGRTITTSGYDAPPFSTRIKTGATPLRAPAASTTNGNSGAFGSEDGTKIYILTRVELTAAGADAYESNPSPPTLVGIDDGLGLDHHFDVLLEFAAAGAGFRYNLYRMDLITENVYLAASTRRYRKVASLVEGATTYTDTMSNATLASAAELDNSQLSFVVGPHQAMLFGAIANRVYWSMQANYLCWNIDTRWIDFPTTVIDLVSDGTEMLVLTELGLHRITGDDEKNLFPIAVPNADGCGYPYSLATEHGVAYWTTSGSLALYKQGQVKILSDGYVKALTITPARMAYAHGILYIGGTTPWIVDMRAYPQTITWKKMTEDITGFWWTGSILYVSNGTGIYTLKAATDPPETQGSGLAMTLRTAEYATDKPERLKHFSRYTIEYSGTPTIKWYRDGTLVQTKVLAAATGRTRVSYWLPSGHAKRIFSEITGTDCIIYNLHLEYEMLGGP